MSRWLTIIGLGEEGLEGLTPAARALIAQAQTLVGGERHLAKVPNGAAERLTWASPLKLTIDEILKRRERRVVVLATGDPLWFGIGVTLLRAVPAEETWIVPGVSAFALAAARLGWPLAEVECLTLHGRSFAFLNGVVAPGARLLLLSHDGATPSAVAKALADVGYGPSRLTVLEHMGGAEERRLTGTAEAWSSGRAQALNTVAVECIPGPTAVVRPRVPGLPDDAFRHDGQLTKREVRAATIAALAPTPGGRLWDIGAGCGSVAIEWLRSHRTLAAVAIERAAERCAMIHENAAALGVPHLELVEGEAPAALADLAPPDAVFIGGGITAEGLAEHCWRILRPRGRLVANAVTVEGEARLLALSPQIGGELTRIAISRAEPIGGYTGWRAHMPVTQLAATKR
ncbi:MAG TPA: precorrin-6y C5,15-methyltransferase (decarboxylating) subunit CbiE [Candidatus Acidoferrum sp.]|nr:precorrin-6y C5,15-methyltransferase (decarboxylating) subunit CbiE [Candidatus Acidoferrum sp.]